MCDIEVLRLDHTKVYARWTVIIGGGKNPIKWAKKPPTTHKSTAKLSHIAKVQGRLEPAFARGERLRNSSVLLILTATGGPNNRI